MTDPAVPPSAAPPATAASRTDHELISFAVFLDYRARRMRAPVAAQPVPDVPGAPPDIDPSES